MLLGISSFAYGWRAGAGNVKAMNPLTETDLLTIAHQHNLKCIQFGDNLPVHEFDQSRLDALKSGARSQGIRLELGARGLTTEHLATYIELAKFFNTPLIRFVIDKGSYEPSIASVADIIEDFIPTLEQNNITLGIENHDRFKAIELSFLMESLASHMVGICLDTVNSLGAGEGLDHVVEVLAPYTVNLHIKEFSIRRAPHSMGFEVSGAPVGKGLVNTCSLIERLSKFDRCASAILEQWVPYQADLESTILLEEQWAEESLEYLKSSHLFD